METMDNDIQEASRQLDATGASLDALMRPGQTDIKQAFDAYSDQRRAALGEIYDKTD